MLLLLYFGCATNHMSIPFGYLCWLGVIRFPICVLWSLQSCIGWWSRKQVVRRYHSGWHMDTLGGFFENVPAICLFYWWSLHLVKTKLQVLGLLSLSARKSGFLDTGLKASCFVYLYNLQNLIIGLKRQVNYAPIIYVYRWQALVTAVMTFRVP